MNFTAANGSAGNYGHPDEGRSVRCDFHDGEWGTTDHGRLVISRGFRDSQLYAPQSHGRWRDAGERRWLRQICNTGGFILTLNTLVGGSGYTNATYNEVPLTGGSGVMAFAQVVVSAGAVTAVTFPGVGGGGYGYAVGDTFSASNAKLGGAGSGFSIKVATIADSGQYAGFYPPAQQGGQGGWKATDWVNYCTVTYPTIFSDFPGRYVWITLGSNMDATLTDYYNALV